MHANRKNTNTEPFNGHPEWDKVDSLAFMHDPMIELPEITDEMVNKGLFKRVQLKDIIKETPCSPAEH
jgi:hypothetical protein